VKAKTVEEGFRGREVGTGKDCGDPRPTVGHIERILGVTTRSTR
jgi:hypothetical protein